MFCQKASGSGTGKFYEVWNFPSFFYWLTVNYYKELIISLHLFAVFQRSSRLFRLEIFKALVLHVKSSLVGNQLKQYFFVVKDTLEVHHVLNNSIIYFNLMILVN